MLREGAATKFRNWSMFPANFRKLKHDKTFDRRWRINAVSNAFMSLFTVQG